MQEELKPCGHCGSPAEMRLIGNDHTKTRSVTVKCTNLECRMERTDKALRHGHEWLKAVAIENWNRRTPVSGEVAEGVDADRNAASPAAPAFQDGAMASGANIWGDEPAVDSDALTCYKCEIDRTKDACKAQIKRNGGRK